MSKKTNIIYRILGKFSNRFRPYYSYFDYYENQMEQFNLQNLATCFSESSINNINTSKEISFYTFPFLTDCKQVIKKIGRPRFHVKHPQISELSGSFYRKKVGNSKITVLCLFFNNKLVFGSYIFDHFNSSSFFEIEKLLRGKYVTTGKSVAITDSCFNRIEFVHDVYNRINFISGDKSILIALNTRKELTEQLLLSKAKVVFSDLI